MARHRVGQVGEEDEGSEKQKAMLQYKCGERNKRTEETTRGPYGVVEQC